MGSLVTSALNSFASLLWATGTACARSLSKSKTRLPAKVISIGNIQVGGAGKTPLVAYLAGQAHERGKQVCILTRGYGAQWEKAGGVITPQESDLNPADCGDEALLLHELAPYAWIGVGADRARQFHAVADAIRAQGLPQIDLVILDDGFQNHRLEKDLDIVALTSAHWGQKIFRDFRSALKKAHLLVWTKGDECPRALAKWGRPFVRVHMKLDPPFFASRFLLITGLADGAQARRSMEQAGYRIEKHLTFPDHARYASIVTQTIIDDARTLGLKLLMTGKDWVKWRTLVGEQLKGSMIEVVEPQLRLDPEDEKIWNQVIWES
ncbi:MAG: tetraacyldisaccharide 4'-kinase [Bdellovibrionia bacterium]